MKHKINSILILLLFTSMCAAQEQPDDLQSALDGYLETAAANNPGLRAKFSEYMAALEVVPQVSTLPDPQIAFAYFIRPVETRVGPQRFRISASQMFPWFGTLEARENVAVQAAKATFEEFEEARSALFNDVKAVYFNLYFSERAMAVTMENILLLQSIQNLVTVKLESGEASMVDEYRVELEAKDLEDQLARLKDRHWVLEQEFRSLLNADSNLQIQLPEQLWRLDFAFTREEAVDSIRRANHQLLEMELRQASLSFRKELAKREGNPALKIGLDYTVIGKGPDQLEGRDAFVFPTVGITIPLYRNKYKAMVREVAYLEEANRLQTNAMKNRLEVLFDKAWKDYRDAKRRISLNEQQMTLAGKALRLLESEYATAGSDFEEILRMERRLLKYNLEFEKALADKQAAIAFMEYLMGK